MIDDFNALFPVAVLALAICKRSVDLWREHPVWGVGTGNSPLYLNSTGDKEETVVFVKLKNVMTLSGRYGIVILKST
jgi:hypothetical protein